MRIRFLSSTHIRSNPKDASKPPIGIIYAGTEVEVNDRIFRGAEIDGINTFFRDDRGWYYWTGRAVVLYKALNEGKAPEPDSGAEQQEAAVPPSETDSTEEPAVAKGIQWSISLGD